MSVSLSDRVERIGTHQNDLQVAIVQMLELNIAIGSDGRSGVIEFDDVETMASAVVNQEEVEEGWTPTPAF